jgi:hypothetical protein
MNLSVFSLKSVFPAEGGDAKGLSYFRQLQNSSDLL